jgi:hypothetical protein
VSRLWSKLPGPPGSAPHGGKNFRELGPRGASQSRGIQGEFRITSDEPAKRHVALQDLENEEKALFMVAYKEHPQNHG